MPTARTTVKRHPERGAYDRATIDAILDEALGRAHEVTETQAKLHAMECVVEHIVPGRWSEARRPNEQEIKGTTILAVPLELDLRRGRPYSETT